MGNDVEFRMNDGRTVFDYARDEIKRSISEASFECSVCNGNGRTCDQVMPPYSYVDCNACGGTGLKPWARNKYHEGMNLQTIVDLMGIIKRELPGGTDNPNDPEIWARASYAEREYKKYLTNQKE